jgi:hypothetical protein
MIALGCGYTKNMDRDELVLAAMAPGRGHRYTPVQVQKLLFLIERQVSRDVLEGPHFNFQPYHYGPFDAAVYSELEELASRGLVSTDQSSAPRTFGLTPEGEALGNAALARLPDNIQNFFGRASAFVRMHSFSSLVSAIYKAFPEMRVNSVFQV